MKTGIATCTFRRSDNKQLVHDGYPVHGPDELIDQWRRKRLLIRVAPGTEGYSMIVTALQDFPHGGKTIRKGDTPNIVSTAAYELAKKGLVSLTGVPKENPPQAVGQDQPSFALPPVQASEQTTLSESEDGEILSKRELKRRRKLAEESS